MSAFRIALIIILPIIWVACIVLAVYGVLKIAEGDFKNDQTRRKIN